MPFFVAGTFRQHLSAICCVFHFEFVWFTNLWLGGTIFSCRLMHEFKLYAPRTICTQLKWKDVFLDLYACRRLFQSIEGQILRGEDVLSQLGGEVVRENADDPVPQPIQCPRKNLFQVFRQECSISVR